MSASIAPSPRRLEHRCRPVRQRRDRRATISAAVVGALTTAVVVRPSIADVLPPCPLHAATGLDSPGCGMTRAVQAVAGGDRVAAIAHNAVATLLLIPLLVVVAVAWVRDRPVPALIGHRAFMPLFVGVVTVFTVLRNIPLAPFEIFAA